MPVTQEEIQELTGGSPQDAQFAASSLTLQLYNQDRKELGGLISQITSGIHAEGEKWNPEAVISNLEKYDSAVHGITDDQRHQIETDDPALGPVYLDWLANMSGRVSTMKNMALPRFAYEENRAVYEGTVLGQQQALIARNIEANAEYATTISGLIGRLDNIGG
jgi:hypothetical protein